MKRYIFWILGLAAMPALAADVGVSITVGEPGFYGRIDIGDFPHHPHVIYPQPVFVGHVPAHRPPIYMHVPPGHAKHWDKYCHQYRACGERVYFVKEDWYNNRYVPHYQEKHRGHGGDRHGGDRYGDDRGGKGKGKDDHPGKHGK